MTVLVTGGAGYIGSHMTLNLIENGEKVVVVDNLSTGFDWVVPEHVELVVMDIGDQVSLTEIMKSRDVESVIHFAGSIIVPDSVSDPLSYYQNNALNSHALISACVSCGVKNFIFSSTAAVYGTPETELAHESSPKKPQSPYGRSKLMTEMMLQDTAAAHDFNFIALRYFNVAGADPKGRAGQSMIGATHLIKVACEVALGKREKLQIFGGDYPTRDGTCVRDYIHVSDLVDAHYLALERLRSGGESMIANCGYGTGYSVLEVVNALASIAGHIEVEHAPRRPGDAASVVADSTRCINELKWSPKHDSLDEIIRHALAWEDTLQKRNRL